MKVNGKILLGLYWNAFETIFARTLFRLFFRSSCWLRIADVTMPGGIMISYRWLLLASCHVCAINYPSSVGQTKHVRYVGLHCGQMLGTRKLHGWLSMCNSQRNRLPITQRSKDKAGTIFAYVGSLGILPQNLGGWISMRLSYIRHLQSAFFSLGSMGLTIKMQCACSSLSKRNCLVGNHLYSWWYNFSANRQSRERMHTLLQYSLSKL